MAVTSDPGAQETVRRQADRDEGQAIALLERAHQLDPDNSAPLLFVAAIENRRGHKAESESLLERAQSFGRRYDSYMPEISRALFSGGALNAKDAQSLVVSCDGFDLSRVQSYSRKH